MLKGIDQFVHKTFGGEIGDFSVRIFCEDVVSNRMEQVGFSEAGRAIEKKWIVLACRLFCDRDR